MKKKMPRLYLIPTPISEDGLTNIPSDVVQIVHELRYFIVERSKTARTFIKNINPPYEQKDIFVSELDKHRNYKMEDEVIQWMNENRDIGLLSEAGCPCVADPGFLVVRMAMESNYEIHPLVGPSSLILGLMASGMNGQNFTFHGYLPVDNALLRSRIRSIESEAIKSGYTQIFIETPYRSHKMFDSIVKWCNNSTRLSINANITSEDAIHITKKIANWKKKKIDLKNMPVVFCLGQ